jgi:hypothetical protein
MSHLWSWRRVILSLLLLLAMTLFAAVLLRDLPRGEPTTPPTPAQHQIYHRILVQTPDAPGAVWSHNQRVDFVWQAQAATAPGPPQPVAVSCTVSVYGPYPSEAAALEALRRVLASQVTPVPDTPPPFPVLRAITLDTYLHDSTDYRMPLDLPDALAPGHYGWVAQAVEGVPPTGSVRRWTGLASVSQD